MDRMVCFPASGTENQDRQHLAKEATIDRISPAIPGTDDHMGLATRLRRF